MAGGKSVKSAVVIIPPDNLTKQIQDIRRVHDKAYQRWMPHINLIYPYLEDTGGAFDKEAPSLLRQLASLQPFHIAFNKDSIGYFNHGSNYTVWLKPMAVIRRTTRTREQPQPPPIQPTPKSQPPIAKVRKPAAPALPLSYHLAPQHSKSGAKTFYTCPIPDHVRKVPPPSLDNLKDAYWRPSDNRRQAAHNGGGFESLRFAEWTPENTFSTEYVYTPPQTYIPTVTPVTVYDVDDIIEDDDETMNEWETVKKERSHKPMVESIEMEVDSGSGHHTDVLQLQAVLQDMYPGLDDLSTRSPDGFQPHLTLGQCRANRINSFIDELKRDWRDITFEVSHIYLISRKGQNDPFRVKKNIPLGSIDTDITE